MAPLNRAGAGRALPRPARQVTAEQVDESIRAGHWVVDLRGRDAFARAHLAGTVSVEYSDQFATYVGWLVPWHDDLVLLCDTPSDLDSALHDLAGIGIDGPGTHVLEPAAELTATYRRSDWADFLAHTGPRVVVDVRQRDEYDDGHLPAPSTSRSTTSTGAATSCRRASSGCTASRATGLGSRPASCTGWAATSFTSTTRGRRSPTSP